jgi:pimeloyl-ACP methyl ester carboxylesterase
MSPIVTKIVAKLLGLSINLLSYIAPVRATALAYRYFSKPLYGKLKRSELPGILREAQLETVLHNGNSFQSYIWPGNEIKVLLVHGWESNASRWKLLISYLRKAGCTIIALDAPAHGLTSGNEYTIPKYAEYVNVMVQKYQPQYLVGHSLGGATTLFFQAHYPNPFVEKLVILGAPSELTIVLNNYRKTLGLNKRIFKNLKTYCTERFGLNPMEFSAAAFARKIDVPGLIVHDREDETVAFTEGQRIAEAYTNAKFIATKGMGHRLHDDALYKRIYTFLFEEDETVNEEIA